MKLLTSLALLLALTIGANNSANASIIKLNDNIELGTLTLTESFQDFYGYSQNAKHSSSTGYEKNNAMVMFFAEYENNLALFVLADSAKSNGKGKAKFTINNLNEFGKVIFKDDPTEKGMKNGVSWSWAAKKNDGLIFQLKNPAQFDLDIVLSGVKGLGNGYQFLSFDENNKVTKHNFTQANSKGQFSASVIPEPTSIAILSLALFGLAAVRRKA